VEGSVYGPVWLIISEFCRQKSAEAGISLVRIILLAEILAQNLCNMDLGATHSTTTFGLVCILEDWWCERRSQWPCGLRHELPSLACTLGSWVRIPLYAWISVCVYSFCVVLCVGSGLAMGWSHFQGVLPTLYRIKKLKKRPRSNKGL
jgi:hypothetical protein